MSKESFQGKAQLGTPHRISGLARKLVQMQRLDEAKALELIDKSKKNKTALVTCLIEENIISSNELALISSEEFGIPFFNLKTINYEYIPKNILNEKIIHEHHCLPIFKRGNRLHLAISDPTNVSAVDEFRFSTGLSIEAI